MASLHLPLVFLLLTPILHFANAAFPAPAPLSLPGCKTKCGNITAPYPFGLQPGCFRVIDTDSPLVETDTFTQFNLVCNESYNPPKLFTNGFSNDYEIVDISLLSGEFLALETTTRNCYNSSGSIIKQTSSNIPYGPGFPFYLSPRNRFFTIGCPNQGFFVGEDGLYVSGCVSACISGYDWSLNDGSCSGIGCCESPIPRGLYYYEPHIQILNFTDPNQASVLLSNSTNCMFVFLADFGWFHFDRSYLSRTEDFRVQVVFDWAIRDMGNCSYARRNLTNYACRSVNHSCSDSVNGHGYLCNCSEGFQGNPYITGGCQGVSVGVFLVAFTCFWLYLGMLKRKLIRAKQRFFEQNGGVLLQQQMKSFKTTTTFRIYSEEELKKATDNFSDERVLGRGGHGIVYKGILEDGAVVAIKKSKLMEEHETKDFAKEMLILSQINHKNVVKLFGCCLEVEVPMLVYEFISNGTLYHYIHDKNFKAFIPTDVRLRIAAESADALAYMHSSASPPILHGDVKSANVLLDDNFVAKVSDFGASKLAPNDEAEIATLVQGTCGYLDPEYLLTCQLTDKSDVYSFAVIILELLTRKKALYFEGPEDDRCLASSFCTAKKEGRLFEIFDAQVRDELKIEVIEEIGDLVMQCLNMNREERPAMREVSERLEKIRRFEKHPRAEENAGEEAGEKDTESLLGDSIDIYARDRSMSYSFAHQAVFDLEVGRRRTSY